MNLSPFISNAYFRHLSAMDTELFVHKVQFVSSAYARVRATLRNWRNGEVYETKTYNIKRADWPKWNRA